MIDSETCGRPTWFLTVSPADTFWPEFFVAVGVDPAGLNAPQRK
jgi:hypothetical protein